MVVEKPVGALLVSTALRRIFASGFSGSVVVIMYWWGGPIYSILLGNFLEGLLHAYRAECLFGFFVGVDLAVAVVAAFVHPEGYREMSVAPEFHP